MNTTPHTSVPHIAALCGQFFVEFFPISLPNFLFLSLCIENQYFQNAIHHNCTNSTRNTYIRARNSLDAPNNATIENRATPMPATQV
jgi:hypothetical protein